MEVRTGTERAAIEARREYHRQWRAKNKDKVRKYNVEYWQRKATQNDSNADRATDAKEGE